jgi:hypothetical protein
MGHIKIQNRLSRINGLYQQCMDELEAHGIDTTPFVLLQIERFALLSLLLEEIRGLGARVDALRKTDAARKKRRPCHVS